MTKYGLRARVLAFTILPTLIIGGLMAGYFTFHRYQQLENNLIDQGINIIEPLAIASEYGMTQHSRESLKRLIGLTHRKNPFIKSIAVFTRQPAVRHLELPPGFHPAQAARWRTHSGFDQRDVSGGRHHFAHPDPC